MAIFFEINTKNTLELPSFISKVKKIYKSTDDLTRDKLHHLAILLQELANNKNWLPEIISKSVINQNEYLDIGSNYGNDALVVYVNQNPFFQIRICFWNPTGKLKKPDELFDVYQSAHDHNFAFLTANYYGPGYVSSFYQYEYRENLEQNDKIDITTQLDKQLSSGQVVFYEPSKDIHLQHPPTAFSISLNLMFELNGNKQYVFDIKNKTINEVVLSSNETAKIFVEELLEQL